MANPYLKKWRLPYDWLLKLPPAAALRKEEDRIISTVLAANIKQGESVLEIGSGTGYFTEKLLKLTPEIICIEESPAMAAVARKRLRHVYTIGKEPMVIIGKFPDAAPSGDFDHVVAIGVLDYTEDYARFLREASKIAKKSLVFTAVEKYPWGERGIKLAAKIAGQRVFLRTIEDIGKVFAPQRVDVWRAETHGGFAASTLVCLVRKTAQT